MAVKDGFRPKLSRLRFNGIDSHSCGRAASKEIAPGIDTEFVREIEALSFLIDCAYVFLFGIVR